MSASKWKPYPEYQVTQIEWNTRIPKKWKIVPLRYLCKIKTGEKDLVDRNPNGEYPFFVRSPKVERISTYSYDGEGILTAGDGNIGDIFHYVNGKFDYHQRVYLFYEFDDILARFLYYFLKANLKKVVLAMSAKSTVDSIRLPMLSSFPVSMPSINEQRLITNFIQIKEEKITVLIHNLLTILESLQEKRSALITQTVTKGLNLDVEMKDSGIDWIGEIPNHWEIKPLRYIGKCQNGISASAEYFGHGHPFVNYKDVYDNPALPFSVDGMADSSISEQKTYSIKRGDVLFTRTSETVDEIGITSTCIKTIPNSTFAGFLIRLRPQKDILLPEFSKYFFRSNHHRTFFTREMNIVTRASLSQELLKRLPVFIPSKEEQQQIVDYLELKTRIIDEGVKSILSKIEKLKEFRTSFISAAVTGKIDVRGSV